MSQLAKDYQLLRFLDDRAVFNRPNVRAIQSLDELRDVYRLTHACYVQNEYATPHVVGMFIHYPYFDHDPGTTILVALLHGEIVGSVSVSLDGPGGLTVDEDFGDVCNASRSQGKRLAAVWRLVVDEKHRRRREIVTTLIRAVVSILRKNKIEDCYFAVNPRHVRIYQKILNMRIVAVKTATRGLSNAPAVLLVGDPFNIPARLSPLEDVPTPISLLLSLNPF